MAFFKFTHHTNILKYWICACLGNGSDASCHGRHVDRAQKLLGKY